MPNERRPPVDREAAFQYWAALPQDRRSYAAVAAQFAISPRTVERYARDGHWRDRLRRIRHAASERADEKLGRELAKQLADFQQLIEASCVTYARQLATGDLKISAAEFVGLIKATLLLHGAPTARVENVSNSEEWQQLRGRILDALTDHPEARIALADALADLEGADDEQADS